MEKSCPTTAKSIMVVASTGEGVSKFHLEHDKIGFYEASGMISTYLLNGIAKTCLKKFQIPFKPRVVLRPVRDVQKSGGSEKFVRE